MQLTWAVQFISAARSGAVVSLGVTVYRTAIGVTQLHPARVLAAAAIVDIDLG